MAKPSYRAVFKSQALRFREFSSTSVLDRIASQTIVTFVASVAPSILHYHKKLPKFIVRPTTYMWLRPVQANFPIGPPSQSDEGTTNNSLNNVPLQTREHALAGISGMLRSLAGAQGAFTSRGAKPKGLNLMLLGLTNQQTNNSQTPKAHKQFSNIENYVCTSPHGSIPHMVNLVHVSFRFPSMQNSLFHRAAVCPLRDSCSFKKGNSGVLFSDIRKRYFCGHHELRQGLW